MSAKLFTIVVAIFLALAFVMFLFIDSFNSKVSEATGLVVSVDSFPVYLETHPIISSLPKSASVGIKIGETFYEVEGNKVSLGNDFSTKDVIVTLPSGFEDVIGSLGLCGAIKKANNDKELVVETFSSKTSLLFKYRKLLKYSDCLK